MHATHTYIYTYMVYMCMYTYMYIIYLCIHVFIGENIFLYLIQTGIFKTYSSQQSIRNTQVWSIES